MIDWHCHLLPGIDDGPATMEGALEMARALYGAGYRTVYCTPHFVKGSYDADNNTVRAALVGLRGALAIAGIPLELLPGREYYLDEFLLESLNDPLPLGDTRNILIEIPDHAPSRLVKDTCYRVKRLGYTPMIAHPERCSKLAATVLKRKFGTGLLSRFKQAVLPKAEVTEMHVEKESILGYLREIECCFQGNLGSFAGRYGRNATMAAEAFRAAGIYTCFGTDAHRVEGILPG